MACCKEYTSLKDQIVTDDSTICGGLLTYDLSSLLTTSEISLSPEYDLLSYGGNYVEEISLNGSVVEVQIKNPDDRPYEEVLIASISADSFNYRVRVKIKFLDRCANSNCVSPQVCNPCTGDCDQGEVDASISIIDPLGTADLGISIQ